jgi:hypothetical protein
MVVRVIWVIATIASAGLGIALYGICWLAFPSDLHPAPISELPHLRDRSGGYIVGLVLLGIGAIFVFAQIAALHPMGHAGAFAWATILIAGGLAVLFLRNNDDDDEPAIPDITPPPADPTDPEPPPAASESFAEHDTDTRTDTGAFPPPVFPGPPVPPIPPTSSAWTQTEQWPTAPPPRVRKPRPRSFLTPVTISLLLIGAGACALLDAAGAVNFTLGGVLASGLILVGLAMVVSTWFGRAHGLIPIGLILLLVTIPAVVIDVPLSGGVGDHVYRPTTRAEMQTHYKLGIGQLSVDLRDAPLANRISNVTAQLGIGELSVDVPTNVRVDVQSHVGAGHIELFGNQDGGAPDDAHAIAGSGQRGVLHLDLKVGAGAIIVRRWTPSGVFIPTPPVVPQAPATP